MEFTQEKNLYAEIVQEAWENPQFKSELVANPVSAIEKLTGKKLNLSEGKTIVVRDQTDESTVYINIPAQPKNTADVELSEEQLELVAGGAIGGINGGGCTTGPVIIFEPTPTFPKDIIFY